MYSHSLLSSITEPTQLQGEGEPPVYEPSQPPSLAPCEDGCDQDKVEQGGIKRVCFKVNEEDQEDSGHDTMSYRDSYRWLLTLVTYIPEAPVEMTVIMFTHYTVLWFR